MSSMITDVLDKSNILILATFGCVLNRNIFADFDIFAISKYFHRLACRLRRVSKSRSSDFRLTDENRARCQWTITFQIVNPIVVYFSDTFWVIRTKEWQSLLLQRIIVPYVLCFFRCIPRNPVILSNVIVIMTYKYS